MSWLLRRLCKIIAVAMTVLMFAGCAPKYGVDFKMPGKNGFEVTVRGPANKLAVMLVSQKGGEPIVRTIEENEMIGNCKTVNLPVVQLREGNWVLMVKTYKPERIVWHGSVVFTAENLVVNGFTVNFVPNNDFGNFHGYEIDKVSISLLKTGNIPVTFSDEGGWLKINGAKYEFKNIKDIMMLGQAGDKGTLSLDIYSGDFFRKFYQPNQRVTVDGKIFYGQGENRKAFSISSNFTTPPVGGSQQTVALSQTSRPDHHHHRPPTE